MKANRFHVWWVAVFLAGAALLVPACMTDSSTAEISEISTTSATSPAEAVSPASEDELRPPDVCIGSCTTTAQCIAWCDDPNLVCSLYPGRVYGRCLVALTDPHDPPAPQSE